MRFSIILFLFIVCISCNNIGYDYSIISFDKEISVEGQKDTIFDSSIGTLAIFSTGKYIVASHVETEHCFSIYSAEKSNIEYICSFGKRGNGPNEFLSPSYKCYIIENNETKIWVIDNPSKRLAKINIEKTINKNEIVIEEIFLIDNNYSSQNCFYVNDSILIGEFQDNECSKYIYNLYSKKNIYESSIPLYNQNSDISNNFKELTRSVACFNPHTKKMVSVSFDLPLINAATLNETNDSLIMRDIYYKEFIPQEDYKYNLRSMSYFASITNNAKYICALYYGYTYDEEDYLEEVEVLIFDWNLKPIVKLKIPQATWITMDENNILYAFNFNVEENMLEVFDLNKILADI